MKIDVHSIKFRTILALVCLLAAVLLINVLYIDPINQSKHMAAAKRSQEELARQIASGIDFTFGLAVRELETVAKLPDIRSMKKERLDRALAQLTRVSQFFSSYYVLDTNGIWVSHPADPRRVGQQNMGWQRHEITDEKTLAQDVIVTYSNKLVSGFSTPIRSDDGKAVGILRGAIIVSAENTVLSLAKEAKVGRNGYAFVVSSNGWLIAHPNITLDAGTYKQYDYNSYPPVEKVVRGEEGILEYDYDGRTWIAAYHPMESTGWGVVVQQPRSDVIAAAKDRSHHYSVLTLSTFLFGSLLLYAFLGFTLRPLYGLVDNIRSRRLAEASSFPKGEIGQIASEFNSLYSELAISSEELKEHRNRLEELVEERTRDLSDANLQLEHEIAERQRAEAVLRESEEKFRDLFENANDPIFIVDPDLNYKDVNKKAVETFGFSREEFLRMKVLDLIPPEQVSRSNEEFRRLQSEGFYENFIGKVRTKDGRWLDVEISSSAIYKEGMYAGSRDIVRDITGRKRAEERISESERRFRAAFENAAVGASMADMKGRFIKVNRFLCNMLGYSEEEMLSRTFSEVTHPDDVWIGLDHMKKMIVGEADHTSFEKRYIRKDGQLINVLISPAIIRDSDGRPLHFVALFQDMTARKQAEEKMKASLKEKEVLLQEVHHRVKNNMQVITSLLRLQSRYVKDEDVARQFTECRDRIRSMALIHEKLYMSDDLANINFKQYAESLIKSMKASFESMSGRISIHMDVDDILVNTDTAIPCGLIINELVSNSYRYAFPDDREGKIRISLKRENDDELVLTVADNGIGMPEDIDIAALNSLGLELVTLLSENQLRGRVEFNTTAGTEFKLRFKELDYKKRV